MKNTTTNINSLLNELFHLYSNTLTEFLSEMEIVNTFKRIKNLYQQLKDQVTNNPKFEEIGEFVFITDI
ncbi:hypothetical protein ACMAZF_20330 (plasmid) [Psychrobium sp. nBUS_13]|uniref:hypothetical protein n=1 Tax=Psychrobium sp. nBUS_13 TaxID=3395319 RepID=UPI003EBFCB7B